MDDLSLYIDVLYEGLEGWVYSPTKGDTWEQKWFEYPTQREQLLDHIRSSKGDVYISPAIYSEQRATKDSIKKLQTCWIEFDGNVDINFQSLPMPTMIVQTSSTTHLHCYWKINPTNQTSIEDINRRLTYYLQADSSGWDATQLLRPPTTINHKRELPVILTYSDQSVRSAEEFSFVPPVLAPASDFVSPENVIPTGQVLANHQLPLKLLKMVKRETPVEPYRSSFLARLANELAEEDLSHIEIVSLLKEADGRINKYTGRGDQMVRLSQIADYAIHKHIAEEELVVYDPEYILKYVDTVQWILPNILHTTGQLVISSAPGVGKTQWCLQLAYCLEKGIRFLGMLAPSYHRVFFMSLEMDKQGLKYIFEHHKNEWESLPTFKIIDEASSLTYYEDLIAKFETTVLMVDSLTELFDDTSENPNFEARRVMKWCRKVRRRYGLAVVLIHHNRKASESNKKPKGLADLVGSFQFGKDSDTVIQLWEDHRGIELSLVKARYGPKDTYLIDRNENLWFTRKGHDSNTEQSVQPNPTGNSPKFGISDRHGNSDDKSVSKSFPAGFKFNDRSK